MRMTCVRIRERLLYGRNTLTFDYRDLRLGSENTYRVQLDLDHLACLCEKANGNVKGTAYRRPIIVHRKVVKKAPDGVKKPW